MQLGVIKKRIITNQNVLKITKSLKIMSLTRLKSLVKKEKAIKMNLSKIQSIQEAHSQHPVKIEQNEEQDADTQMVPMVLHLFLFTDMSFCGGLNKSTETELQKIRNTNNKNENLIIGNKGKRFAGEFCGKLYDKDLLSHVYHRIVKYFHNTKTKEDFSYIHQSYTLNLYMLNAVYTMEYKFFDNEIEQIVFNGYFKYLLQDYLVKFQKEEARIRLMKLTAAIDNSEQLGEHLTILYNKTRHKLITSELLETIASSV